MTATKRTRRPARSITLTMTDFAAAWWDQQQTELAARPADATAKCPCCDEVYAAKGLKRIDSDAVYEQAASRECSFERDDLVCAPCRRSFEASYGREDTDVYHVYDRGLDRAD